jgi:hypothetical protein
MPTVLWIGPYRFFFYSRENQEPPHIHVERDDNVAKYWLEPVALASNRLSFTRTHTGADARDPASREVSGGMAWLFRQLNWMRQQWL